MDSEHVRLVKSALNPLTKQMRLTAVETATTLKLKAELDDDLNELVFDSGGQLYVNEDWCFKIQLLRHLKAISKQGVEVFPNADDGRKQGNHNGQDAQS